MLAGPITQKDPKPTVSEASQTLPDPFVFVPITGKEAAKGRGAAKQIVRAHVTRIQHAKSSALSALQELQTWTVKPCIHGNTVPDTVPTRRKQRTAVLLNKRRNKGQPEENGDDDDKSKELPVAVVPKIPTGTAGDDPFWSYPVEYQPYLAPIFAHYIQNVAVEIPDIDGPNEKGLLRRCWFPLAMTEAATM